MSESKHPCPFCERPVGGVHADDCSRSAPQMRRMAQVSKVVTAWASANYIWLSKRLGTRTAGQAHKGTFLQTLEDYSAKQQGIGKRIAEGLRKRLTAATKEGESNDAG